MEKNGNVVGDQLSRFKETARALGCNEDKVKFEAQLRKIAAHKPTKDKPARGSPKKPRKK